MVVIADQTGYLICDEVFNGFFVAVVLRVIEKGYVPQTNKLII